MTNIYGAAALFRPCQFNPLYIGRPPFSGTPTVKGTYSTGGCHPTLPYPTALGHNIPRRRVAVCGRVVERQAIDRVLEETIDVGFRTGVHAAFEGGHDLECTASRDGGRKSSMNDECTADGQEGQRTLCHPED